MPQPVNLKLKEIQHIGVPVTNIQVSEVFYRNLGFENVMQANFIHENEQGICIMMKQRNIIMELYQMPSKELAAIAARKDGHVDHVAFDVDDIDATFSILSNAGYHIIESAPVQLNFWKKGCKYFNILGPDCERLEFNQVL
jgi:catechol 2,3-dioxygenase-like lactoylglutathione lyase family enzyme